MRALWIPAVLLSLAACSSAPVQQPAPQHAGGDFDALIADILRGRNQAQRNTDPLRGLTAAGSRETREAVERQLARLRAVDTVTLSEPQRIDFLALEASLKGRVADAAEQSWRRSPMAYLPFDPIFRPLAGDDDPAPDEWRRVATSLRTFRRWDPLESTCRHASLSIL